MIGVPKRQRGVALLVALLVVALAVILIAALLERGELALARTRNVLRSEQAEAYAQGLEIYAAQILATTALNGGADTNASPWALPLPPQPVPGGMISATMRDLNGCFNINNLSKQGGDPGQWSPIFRNLLTALGIDPNLVDPIKGWLDSSASGDNTGANYYLALPVPYRPRGGLFAHVSELRLVRGVTGDVYARLAPHVCALPPGTKINVNTASAAVLQSLLSGMSRATAENLWQNGAAQWSTDSFKARLQQLGVPVDRGLDSKITSSSSYFLARGDIVLDDVPFTFYSLLERGSSAGGIRVLERSRGSDDALVAPAPVASAGRKDETTLR
jgi:general secretion pathway protein K